MRSILPHCGDVPVETVPAGTVLLTEGQTTGHVYVLVRGRIEVLRGDTQIAVLEEPGSLLGEMSVLLGAPHTATARTLDESTIHVIEDGITFFSTHPSLSWLVARLLATRLNVATSYLADLKRQYADQSDHLQMVGEELETLLHQQNLDFDPGSERDPGRA